MSAHTPYTGRGEGPANAARIVACVNGCQGLNPAAYRALVTAIQAHLTVTCPGLADTQLLDALTHATEGQP